VGKGTQFQVFLPAIEALVTPQVENLELPRGNGELILIVDDEASIIEISKTSLDAYNYRAIAARNGFDAIALYAKYQTEISVVLIDMMMPSMDGLALIRQLQQMNPRVNIITMSGLLANEKVGEAVGVKAFLSKPFTIKELLSTIQDILSAS
ncbi:MAG TPA: response regulator, partial [Coleofasciculaceae cyanobacterium]